MDRLREWINKTEYKEYKIEIASSDASFRKYYRLISHTSTYIVMDASQEKSTLIPFINVTHKLHGVGVEAPKIFQQNLDEGYLILEDLGSTHYLDILNITNFKELYKKAIDEIIKMQEIDASDLPVYDRTFLHKEMDLMQEWYLEQLLPKKNLTYRENEHIQTALSRISEVVLSQPQNIFVHRDFHSRNILLTAEDEVGVIDYQDAMNGCITYDLVSLLRDAYIEFEEDDIYELALYFRDKKGLDVDDATFIKWFDFMGMQRHIKILGIFSRLYIRDGKRNFLMDIPLTLKYLFDTSRKYDETRELTQLLKKL